MFHANTVSQARCGSCTKRRLVNSEGARTEAPPRHHHELDSKSSRLGGALSGWVSPPRGAPPRGRLHSQGIPAGGARGGEVSRPGPHAPHLPHRAVARTPQGDPPQPPEPGGCRAPSVWRPPPMQAPEVHLDVAFCV